MRAFLISLIAAQPAKVGNAQSPEDRAWQSAVAENTEQAYHDYLSEFPAGSYVRDAIVALQRLGGIDAGPATRGLGDVGSGASGATAGDLY